MHKKLPHIFWVSALVSYLLLITCLSLAPSKTFEGIPTFDWEDVLAHFCMYLGLVFLMINTFTATPLTQRRAIYLALIAIVYGIIIEILQPIVQPHDRQFSIGDILSNSAGALCMCTAMFHWKSRFVQSKKYTIPD